MNSREFEQYFEQKMDNIRQTDELLKSLVGKTIESVEIKHSGSEYYSEINIKTTDGTEIRLETCHGDTDYFTDFRCYNV